MNLFSICEILYLGISKLETLRYLSKILLTVSKMTRFLDLQSLKFVIVVVVLSCLQKSRQFIGNTMGWFIFSTDFLKIDLFSKSLLIY